MGDDAPYLDSNPVATQFERFGDRRVSERRQSGAGEVDGMVYRNPRRPQWHLMGFPVVHRGELGWVQSGINPGVAPAPSRSRSGRVGAASFIPVYPARFGGFG